MISDGAAVYGVKSIDKGTGVAWCYGTGTYCHWIEEFDAPGIIFDSKTAKPISVDCFALTPEEMETFNIRFVEEREE